jgi:hypothetical protein
MNGSLQICASCRRHVRAHERDCPHCGANLFFRGVVRPRPCRIEVRRLLILAAVAGAAAGTSACRAVNEDVQGSCAPTPNQPAPLCDVTCGCGTGGYCSHAGDAGTCVSCNCDSDQYCVTVCGSSADCAEKCYTPTSSHGCYGAPSLSV